MSDISTYSVQVIDENSRNVLSPSNWLDVGRESFLSLSTPHQVTLMRNGTAIADGVVRSASDGAVKISVSNLSVDINTQEFNAFLYILLREGRIAQRSHYDCELPTNHNLPAAVLCQPDLCNRIDFATSALSRHLDSSLAKLIFDQFPSEVVRTIEHHITTFLEEPWPSTVLAGAVTRSQYVRFLFNLHGYVRMTTRLLGHCVGLATDTDLRTHYIHHLNGEINHEKIIETDLGHLGIDLDFLLNYHVPSIPTQQFLAIQQSTVGQVADPVMFLACPIAAESFAAYAKQDILAGLQKSIASWYPGDPRQIAHFVTSHTRFDGGQDGHWIKCVEIVNRYVEDERSVNRFLGILNSSMVSLRAMFNGNV